MLKSACRFCLACVSHQLEHSMSRLVVSWNGRIWSELDPSGGEKLSTFSRRVDNGWFGWWGGCNRPKPSGRWSWTDRADFMFGDVDVHRLQKPSLSPSSR